MQEVWWHCPCWASTIVVVAPTSLLPLGMGASPIWCWQMSHESNFEDANDNTVVHACQVKVAIAASWTKPCKSGLTSNCPSGGTCYAYTPCSKTETFTVAPPYTMPLLPVLIPVQHGFYVPQQLKKLSLHDELQVLRHRCTNQVNCTSM